MNTGKDKKARLFIKNLVFDINERMLTKLFRKFGDIVEINILRSNETNRPIGSAFVQMDKINQSAKAIKKLNNTIYKGRKILVNFAVDSRLFQSTKNLNNLRKQSDNVEEKKED